jgi:hypothetical protein
VLGCGANASQACLKARVRISRLGAPGTCPRNVPVRVLNRRLSGHRMWVPVRLCLGVAHDSVVFIGGATHAWPWDARWHAGR